MLRLVTFLYNRTLEHFIVQNYNFAPINQLPIPSPLAPGNHHSIFCFQTLSTLDISDNWNHTVFVLLRPAYFP